MSQSLVPIIYVSKELPVDDISKEASHGTACVNPSFHDYMMALFDYADMPDSNVMIFCVDQPDYGFPIRARFRTPVVHPLHPEFRRCPNFPTLYVSKDGRLIEECLIEAKFRATISKLQDLYIDYVSTTVPGFYHNRFVSMFRIYADAWGNQKTTRPGHHYPIPKNGDWTDYRPTNIRWAKRYENQMLFEANMSAWASVPALEISDTFCTPDEYLDKLRLTDNTDVDVRPFSPLPRLEESGSGETRKLSIVTNVWGNNRDYCYRPYWYRFVVNGKTGEILPSHSIGTVIANVHACGGTITRDQVRKHGNGFLHIKPTL